MRISYAITVCTEFLEIQRLINFLLKHKRAQDDIVVLFDEANGDKEIEAYLRSHSVNGEFMWYVGKFDRHFANWKNKLNSYCTGDYIFQIDADEIPTKTLMDYLPDIIDANPAVDVLLVPRINTVEGLTQQHIAKWGWNVIPPGWVNFPDYQWRIFKNKPEIKWKNKVHEVLEGYKMMSNLPAEEEYCLFHPKTIERQEKQNNYYDTL
jgi:hypothetical protein